MDVWSNEHGRCVDMVRTEHNGDKNNVYWEAVECGYTCVRNPTHWMRVPPPNAELSGGEAVRSDDLLASSQDYSIALQRAIEHHCRGVPVPPAIGVRCPHHAKMLNEHLANSPICVKTGSGDSANAALTGGVPAVPANGLFSISRFRSVLVKHGIVFPEAIEDAEGFDGERTLAATRAAYEELMENAGDQVSSEAR